MMKQFYVTFDWTIDNVPQANCLPVWASSEANALNIARTRLRTLGVASGQCCHIRTETVSETQVRPPLPVALEPLELHELKIALQNSLDALRDDLADGAEEDTKERIAAVESIRNKLEFARD